MLAGFQLFKNSRTIHPIIHLWLRGNHKACARTTADIYLYVVWVPSDHHHCIGLRQSHRQQQPLQGSGQHGEHHTQCHYHWCSSRRPLWTWLNNKYYYMDDYSVERDPEYPYYSTWISKRMWWCCLCCIWHHLLLLIICYILIMSW
jgi:hypothetical protein